MPMRGKRPFEFYRKSRAITVANAQPTQVTRDNGTEYFRLKTDSATAVVYVGTSNAVRDAGADKGYPLTPGRVEQDYHLPPNVAVWLYQTSGGPIDVCIEEF